MQPTLMTATAAALLLGTASVASAQDAPAVEPTPEAATAPAAAPALDAEPKKITDRRHPDYVRCKSERVIGSLSKRRRVCLTNRQWAEVSRDQGSLARDFIAENTNRSAGQ